MNMKIMLLLAVMFSCTACADEDEVKQTAEKYTVTCVTGDGWNVWLADTETKLKALPVDDIRGAESSTLFYEVHIKDDVYLVPKDQCYIHYKK